MVETNRSPQYYGMMLINQKIKFEIRVKYSFSVSIRSSLYAIFSSPIIIKRSPYYYGMHHYE